MLCKNNPVKNIKKVNIVNFNYDQYRDAWGKAEAAKILTNFPIHLDIELTSECNLKCKMCWQYKDPESIQKGMMKFELFKKIIDEGIDHGLCAIKLQSRGEAMMHPKIFEFSKYAKSKGVKDIQLTTNGTIFMKKNKINQLFESGIDKLIFSIDKEHDESIKEIYKKKKPIVRNYFNEIAETKKKNKLTKPFLVVQTSISENSDKDKIIKDLKKEFKNANHFNLNEIYESTVEIKTKSNEKNKYDYHPCSYLWTRMLIFWDGTTTTCCRDYKGQYMYLGDANKDSVLELWRSQKMTHFRKLHSEGNREKIKICENCDVSRTLRNKN